MSHRPVAITGFGIVCGLGENRAQVSAGLRAGKPCFAPIRRFDASTFKVNLGAEAPDLDIAGRFGRATLRHTSRADQLALVAAADALDQARRTDEQRGDAAVLVGASSGGVLEVENQRLRQGGGTPKLHSLTSYPVWASARTLGQRLGLGGPRSTFMTACSSAAHALGVAMHRVRRGELPWALAGGTETLCRLTLAGFGSLGVLDPRGSRPFDAHRAGITLGEGAAFFVLEPLADAERRGAEILAILAGYGSSADAHHMVHPRDDGEGALTAMRRALVDARLPADAVDYVNAHGTGTKQNDAMEMTAIHRLVEGRPVAVSSSKSIVGHTLGAAGAVELGLSLVGMREGFLPPSLGVEVPLPELRESRLVTHAEAARPRVILSTSFAFGGNNAALVLAHPDVSQDLTQSTAQPVYVFGAAAAGPRGTAHLPDELSAMPSRTFEAQGETKNGAQGSTPTGDDTPRGFVGLDPKSVLDRGAARRMDPLSLELCALGQLALQSAAEPHAADLAIGFATGFGALDATITFEERLFEKGAQLVNPLEFPNLVHNAPAGYASILLGATGHNLTACQEETCGEDALASLAEMVSEGQARRALVASGDLASPWLDAGYAELDRILRTRSRHVSSAGALLIGTASATGHHEQKPWARLWAVALMGPKAGVAGAIREALRRARAAGLPEHSEPDLWLRGGTERLGCGFEDAVVAATDLAFAKRIAREETRLALGDANGGSLAVLAVGAARVKTGAARLVLVTAPSRDGQCAATLLGAI